MFQVTDVAVQPEHRSQELGKRIVDELVAARCERPQSAYVNFLADVCWFYERWRFEPTAPASVGIYRIQ